MSKLHHDRDSAPKNNNNVEHKRAGVSRRQVLAGSASAALVGLVGAARAQYTGVMEGGGGVPFRLPLGALNYLDRNQYIHNMEIISFTEGPQLRCGEPLMSMWARGSQRLITSLTGWLDVSNPRRPKSIDMRSQRRGALNFRVAGAAAERQTGYVFLGFRAQGVQQSASALFPVPN